MSSEHPEPVGAPHTDLWDATADERERLADERERLADTREHLANERERLADEQERLLDEWYTRWDEASGSDVDPAASHREARAALARADARVERALAERERVRAALDRAEEAHARASARAAREAVLAGLDDLEDDERRWSTERRSFVASERDRLAGVRDELQEARDRLADRREQLADERDVGDRSREQDAIGRRAVEQRESADSARGRTARARADLAEVRETARRQRRVAARERKEASASRADAATRMVDAGVMPTAYGPGLTEQFTLLTRALFASQDLATIARRVLDFGVGSIPGCVAAGVAVVGGNTPTLRFATDDAASRLDVLQMEAEQSPIADALATSEPVHVASFEEESRWPDLAHVASEVGIGAMVAYGLSVPRDGAWQTLGSLTLYAEAPDAFDDASRELGGILSCYLSVAAGFERDRTDLSRREAALHRALGTRDVIGQAKGILMERRRLGAGAAFDILRETSQRLNVAVHELAQQLAETGELPA